MGWIERLSDQYQLARTRSFCFVAYNEGRDFREAKWTSTELNPLPGSRGNFHATVTKPESGYVGFYIELETEYEGIPCSLTTEVFNSK